MSAHATVKSMNEVLFALACLVAVFVGTGLTAVFKGQQIQQWLQRREAEVKAAYSQRQRE